VVVAQGQFWWADLDLLTERAGRVSRSQLEAILDGIDIVLGR
jgi:hypothetical protein